MGGGSQAARPAGAGHLSWCARYRFVLSGFSMAKQNRKPVRQMLLSPWLYTWGNRKRGTQVFAWCHPGSRWQCWALSSRRDAVLTHCERSAESGSGSGALSVEDKFVFREVYYTFDSSIIQRARKSIGSEIRRLLESGLLLYPSLPAKVQASQVNAYPWNGEVLTSLWTPHRLWDEERALKNTDNIPAIERGWQSMAKASIS